MTSLFASFPRAVRLGGAALLAVAASQGAALAAEPAAALPVASYAAPAQAAAPQTQSLLVMIDHLKRVSFVEPVKTVLVGNPAIADVTMISDREAVVSARAVGSTNLFFLAADGRALGDYEVVVREGESRRVVLRRGPNQTELYQCAPRCERTLSQMDSGEAHDALSRVVTTESQMSLDAANATGDEAQ